MEREDWNRRYAAEEFMARVDANQFLVSEVASLAPGSALDLAAGEGHNAMWLARWGWIVRAVDFSDVAIEKGKRLAATLQVADKVDYVTADLRGYETDAHCFDLVAMIYPEIPQTELSPILARAAKAVAPGGIFLLVGPHSDNLTLGYDSHQNPDMYYTAKQVVAALGGELVIEKASRIYRPVETADGVKVVVDCLVRGKRPW